MFSRCFWILLGNMRNIIENSAKSKFSNQIHDISSARGRDELQRYENQLFTYFSVGRNSDPNVESQNGLASASKETVQVKIEEENENEEEAVVESSKCCC